MRVLHYIDTFSHTSETFVYDLLRQLQIEGATIGQSHSIVCHKRVNEEDRPFGPIEIVGFGGFPSLVQRVQLKMGFNSWSCPAEKDVLKVVQTRRPQLIHAHFGQSGVRIFNLLKKHGLDIPLIVQFHGSDIISQPLFDSTYKRLILALSQAKNKQLIGNTEFLCSEIQGIGVDPKKIRKVTNALNEDFLQTLTHREDRVRNRVIRVVAVGRLIRWKGHRVLIDAISLLEEKHPGIVELTIVGEGPELKSISHRVLEHNLEGSIKLVGSKPHKELPNLLAEHDIFVQPSIIDEETRQRESFGMTILEAIACGLPVIVTSSGGMPELVGGESSCAKVVPQSSPEAIASAIMDFIENPVDPNSFQAFRADRLEVFSRKKQLSAINEAYNEVLRK